MGAALNNHAQLLAAIELLLRPLREQVAELSERLGASAPVSAAAADPTRPLTAEQLCVRWKIPGGTPALRLHNLAKKARNWGLKPLKGTRGWEALYAQSAVLHAEAYGDGQIKRRRNAA